MTSKYALTYENLFKYKKNDNKDTDVYIMEAPAATVRHYVALLVKLL